MEGSRKTLDNFRENNLVGIEQDLRWVDRQSIQTEEISLAKMEDAISTFGDQSNSFVIGSTTIASASFDPMLSYVAVNVYNRGLEVSELGSFDYIKGHFRDAFFVVPISPIK